MNKLFYCSQTTSFFDWILQKVSMTFLFYLLFSSYVISCIIKHGWHEDVTFSPSRAETPTKPKSRFLPEQPPVWSTRELRCAARLHFLGTLSLSPVIRHQNEENKEVRWVRIKIVNSSGGMYSTVWATHISVRSCQNHVFRLRIEDERGLHNDMQVWKRGIILCENKNSCSGKTHQITRYRDTWWDTCKQLKYNVLPQWRWSSRDETSAQLLYRPGPVGGTWAPHIWSHCHTSKRERVRYTSKQSLPLWKNMNTPIQRLTKTFLLTDTEDVFTPVFLSPISRFVLDDSWKHISPH